MADCSGLLQTGLSFVQKATEQDNAGNYSEAFRLYSLAIEAFLSVIKMERNKRIKQTVARKASEYMARAEQLKEILSAPIEGMQFPSVPSSSLSGLDQVSLNSAAVKETQQQPPGIHFPSPPSVNGYPSSPSSSSAPSSSFPSSPSFAPSSSSSAPSPSFGAEHNRSDDITITLEEGQTGHTFESLFGSYLAGSLTFMLFCCFLVLVPPPASPSLVLLRFLMFFSCFFFCCFLCCCCCCCSLLLRFLFFTVCFLAII
ncbi:MIT domain-containing protein 1, variant 4 [Balamuthia mandrillaris]